MAINKLAINGGVKVINDDSARFVWPRITKESETAIIDQLYESISIYDRSGVIKQFEDEFSDYHGRKYGLLSNSGTSAIFSMYEALNLKPGDEVLCPVYTFHATVSPIIYTGATPIFCDSDDEGNISLESIEKNFTRSTKAVILTHMWGIPAKDIFGIKKFCLEKNVCLLEDCSHAHGSRVSNQPVGTFGQAAAWSLQGQKIITGGEGGIMVTDNKEFYNRALLQGHYNKRPKNEISPSEKYGEYYLTGLGLKLRAHPLAIALALQQFHHLDEFLNQRQIYAECFNRAFSCYPFLKIPTIDENRKNSWYAYSLLFDETKAFGVTRQEFVDALVAEGLSESDIPGSTCLLNDLPLFTKPHLIMPRLYSKPIIDKKSYPNAQQFYKSVIKLPVWTFKDEKHTVDRYIEGIKKVSDYLQEYKGLR